MIPPLNKPHLHSMFLIVHHPGYLDTDWQGNERIIPKLIRP